MAKAKSKPKKKKAAESFSGVLQLNIPNGLLARLNEVARHAGCPVETVISVMLCARFVADGDCDGQ